MLERSSRGRHLSPTPLGPGEPYITDMNSHQHTLSQLAFCPKKHVSKYGLRASKTKCIFRKKWQYECLSPRGYRTGLSKVFIQGKSGRRPGLLQQETVFFTHQNGTKSREDTNNFPRTEILLSQRPPSKMASSAGSRDEGIVQAGLQYWETQPASLDGVLGVSPHTNPSPTQYSY